MRNRQLIALLILTLSATAETPPSLVPGPAQAPAPVPAPGNTVPPQPAPRPEAPRIPDDAIALTALESRPTWKWEHDDQTKGWSDGTSNYPIYPDGHNGLPGRQFVASYGDRGGHRYHLTFGSDVKATHFVYEANVYLVDPSQIANVEMDMNQVMSDGRTVIFGVQCSVHSKSWEYTYVDSSGTHWRPSKISCNPHDWGIKVWHKVQIASHRDDDGNVTYDWIGFDGVHTRFEGATVFSAQALRWTRGELLLNFQINGANKSGIMDAYLNNLAIYRW